MEAAAKPADAAGRADYDQMAHFRGLKSGEPWFLIRGQDLVAGDAARAWAAIAAAAGAPIAVVEQALRQADKLDAWPTKKLPDAGHIDRNEQKQLEYAFGRRAWDARTDVTTSPRLLLAERRALDGARGEVRAKLTELGAALVAEATAKSEEARRIADNLHVVDARDRDAANTALGFSQGIARAIELLSQLARDVG